MLEKFTKNLIPLAIVISALLIAGAFIYIELGKGKEENSGILSPQEAAEKAINYINENQDSFNLQGQTVYFVSATEENSVYKFRLKIGEAEYDSYVTRDGKVLFPSGIDLEPAPASTQEEETPEEIQKSDNPDVKLFVMSYCPYGLQAQKMFLPVYDLLKEKARMGVYFVNYIMHEKQEIDENLKQYCIQKEENGKYYSYLSCFVKEGDSESCLTEAKIDKAKLTACVSETDADYDITEQYNDKSTWLNGNFPKFDVQSDLNEGYGVQGSPTIVINDTVVNVSPRSPEKFKEVVCSAFASPPEECNQTLSDEAASTGIGGGTASADGGSCQ